MKNNKQKKIRITKEEIIIMMPWGENKKLKKEQKRIQRENQNLKRMNWDNRLKLTKAQMLVIKTMKKLDELQNIDRKGTREESKRKERNILISNLKKELDYFLKEKSSSINKK